MTTKPESPDSGAGADARLWRTWKVDEVRRVSAYLGTSMSETKAALGMFLDPPPRDHKPEQNSASAELLRQLDKHTHGASDQAVWVDVADLGFLSDMPPNGSRATRLFNKQVLPCMVPLYTRAQDSGQGEAVAIGQVVASKSRGIETEWYNYLPKPGTKLFSHPPKPAQDAAGKGVDVMLRSGLAEIVAEMRRNMPNSAWAAQIERLIK